LEEGALEALLSIVPEQIGFPKKRGLEIGFLATFLIIRASFGCALSVRFLRERGPC